MARGWESKAVEAQQEAARLESAARKPRLTREATARLREMESLQLSLQNVRQQLDRTRDGRHRALLERALADLEEKIRQVASQVH